MSDTDIAIKRFDTTSRYYAFETTMYWTRSHFFMVANAGFLVFAASNLLKTSVEHPYLFVLACAFGSVMSLCWYAVLRSGQYWTDRWEQVCLTIEPAAMGDIEVFRNCRPAGHVSTKKIARFTALLFFVAWCAAGVWVFGSYQCQSRTSAPSAMPPAAVVLPSPTQSK